MHILKVVKKILLLILFPILAVMFYMFISYVFTFFPSSPSNHILKEKKIYLLHNPMHTDLVFETKELQPYWFKKLPQLKNYNYIAFGWGDKETYLNTPTWNDIKISTSLKALFLNTDSLMHVSYYHDIRRYQDLKEIKLSKEEEQKLEDKIFKSFNFEKEVYKGYGRDDFFYGSPTPYNLFNTCNVWTGDRLRDANVSVSYWTPFSHNVLSSFE